MTILRAVVEDIGFTRGSQVYISGSSRSGYDRGGLYSKGLSWTDPFTPITTGWMAFYYWMAGTYSYANTAFIGLVSGDTGKGIYLAVGSDKTTLAFYKFDGTTWTKLAEQGSVITGNCRMDLHVEDFGADCTLTAYINGTSVLTFTGDCSISGISSLDTIALPNSDVLSQTSYLPVSEIVVTESESTLGWEVVTLAGTEAGDANEMDAGVYTDVNEVTLNDATQIYTDAASKKFLMKVNGLPSGDWVVKAVGISARCVDGTGSLGAKLGIKSGGTESYESTAQNCSGYWQTKLRLMPVNPVTGVAFTPAELAEPLQIGIESGTV